MSATGAAAGATGSSASGTHRGGRRPSRRAIVAAAVVVSVLLAIVVRPQARRPDELGVAGTGPDGLGIVATVLEELGTTVVEVGEGARVDDVLFVPGHVGPDQGQREDVVAHLEAGGRAVVVGTGVDREQLRQRAFVGFALGARTVPAGCDDPRLDGVGEVDTVGNERLLPGPGDVACLGEPDDPDDASLLLVTRFGAGRLDLLAGDAWLRNGAVDAADNAAAATRLLTPDGDGRLVVLRTRAALGVDLLDLVGGRFWALTWWLGVVFAVHAVRRARRLGPPVPERVPVVVEGADLVLAVGGLLARTGDRRAAAEDLRRGLRATLAPRLGVDAGDVAAVREAAADPGRAAGLDPATLDVALGTVAPDDDAALLAVGRAVAATRRAIAGGVTERPPAPAAPAAQERP